MGDRFRDTVFGQVVRLLSGKRLLKFPDELDLTLWKECVQKDSVTASSTPGEKDSLAGSGDQTAADISDSGEKVEKQGGNMLSEKGSRNRHILPQSYLSHGKTKNVILVDWYGPDDQEV